MTRTLTRRRLQSDQRMSAPTAATSGDGPTVVSLFAGCGGSSLGYRMAGFRELAAVDFDADCCETLGLNFPGLCVLECDLVGLDGNTILKGTGLAVGDLDVLDASPPCQGFSISGKRRVGDSRNDLYGHAIRLIAEMQPRMALFENVPAMAAGRMRGRFLEIDAMLRETGYRIMWRTMNAARHGVPQRRLRLFMMAVRPDIGARSSFPSGTNVVVTSGEALRGIAADNGIPLERTFSWKVQAIADCLAPGGKGKEIMGEGHWFNLVLLDPARPAPTCTAFDANATGAGLRHWTGRHLSVVEFAVLQSFPPEFRFPDHCGYAARIKMLGNSVPPLLMADIARHVRAEVLCA